MGAMSGSEESRFRLRKHGLLLASLNNDVIFIIRH